MNNNINNNTQNPANLPSIPAQTRQRQENTSLPSFLQTTFYGISSIISFPGNLINRMITTSSPQTQNEGTTAQVATVTLGSGSVPRDEAETIEEGLKKWVATTNEPRQSLNYTKRTKAADQIVTSYKNRSITLLLSQLNLDTLPSEIGSLTQLITLKLNQNYQLTNLPPEIGRLTQLKTLNINESNLTNLPPEIGNLTHLQMFYLSYNKLETLPSEICNLTQLLQLDLSRNRVTELPSGIGMLIQLQRLYLSSNKLTTLPPEIGRLTHLQSLNLSYNKLTTIPSEIGNLILLEELHLISNQLTTLPTEIGNLTNLSTLDIAGNRNLGSLPMTLGNCQNLTYLDTYGVGKDVPRGEATVTRERDAILERARVIRASQGVLTLPGRLATWKIYGNVDDDFAFLSENFSQKQQCDINEWLFRLERCKDFKHKREELAKLVCKILVTLKDSVEFKDAFFGNVEGNLECCDDRASMLLNTIYTDLMLYTIDTVNTDKQKLELLVRLAKTLALRDTLEKMIMRYELETKTKLLEDVEIYLYHEIKHKRTLNLLTAIDNMHYSQMGRAPNVVNEQELLDTVEARYFDIFVNLDQVDKILVKYPIYMREKSAIERASQEEMGFVFEREYQTDQLKIDAMNAIVAKKNAAILALKKEHVNRILHI